MTETKYPKVVRLVSSSKRTADFIRDTFGSFYVTIAGTDAAQVKVDKKDLIDLVESFDMYWIIVRDGAKRYRLETDSTYDY